MRAHQFDIVQRGKNGAPFAVPPPDQRDEIGDGLGIDGAERLVEQDKGRILQQQAREQDPLELAARECADETVGEVLESDRGERARDLLPVAPVETAPGADLAPQPHGRAVEHGDGKEPVDLDLLREIGDAGLSQTVELEASAERPKLADDAFEQGRLAGAVRADEGEERAGLDLAGDVMHGGMPVVAEGYIAECDSRLAAGHVYLKAQNTAPQSSAESAATIRRRTASERRNSEKPLAAGIS